MCMIYTETQEEFDACAKLLADMRTEKAKAEKRKQAKAIFEIAVANLIEEVGTAEAKTIIREINRDLRREDFEF